MPRITSTPWLNYFDPQAEAPRPGCRTSRCAGDGCNAWQVRIAPDRRPTGPGLWQQLRQPPYPGSVWTSFRGPSGSSGRIDRIYTAILLAAIAQPASVRRPTAVQSHYNTPTACRPTSPLPRRPGDSDASLDRSDKDFSAHALVRAFPPRKKGVCISRAIPGYRRKTRQHRDALTGGSTAEQQRPCLRRPHASLRKPARQPVGNQPNPGALPGAALSGIGQSLATGQNLEQPPVSSGRVRMDDG